MILFFASWPQFVFHLTGIKSLAKEKRRLEGNWQKWQSSLMLEFKRERDVSYALVIVFRIIPGHMKYIYERFFFDPNLLKIQENPRMLEGEKHMTRRQIWKV